MKKLAYYAGIMFTVIILLPLLIVRGCGYTEDETPKKNIPQTVEKIQVFDSTRSGVIELSIEEYIKGVLAAEMPADFDMEALKAQAVAARTFTYGRLKGIYPSKAGMHDGIALCTDHTHCQAWTSKEAAMKKWGIFRANLNWKKIEKAVLETKNMIITYNGEIINALYHANSGGKTENCEDVWAGGSEPYLRSVVSNGEDAARDYRVSTNFQYSDFIAAIKVKFPDMKLSSKNLLSNIKVLDYTTGGRVANIKVGNMTMKGTEFRTLLKLRSAKFSIEGNGKNILKITTVGYGHGVGMSQWGANYLAKRGGTFDEIIKYYYTGTGIMDISEYDRLALLKNQ